MTTNQNNNNKEPVMFTYHGVFEEYGKSPATPQEWQTCDTTHDYVWMFYVTSEFTKSMMLSYLNDHQNPKIVEKEMDQFMEELQRQTGLSVEDTAMYARLGQYIIQDREYRDNPEGARQAAYESFQEHMEVKEQFENAESIEDLDMPEEIVRMAEEFNNMLEDRHNKTLKIEAELASLEAEMKADELAGVFSDLEKLLKDINGEDEAK
jgi:hypothetical protein